MIPFPRHPRRRSAIAAAVTVGAILAVSAGPLSSSAAAGTSSAARAPGTTAQSPAPGSSGPRATTAERQAAATRTVHTVTLITGDIVTVTSVGGGHSTVDVQRPPGATGAVRTETIGKDLYVLPAETLPYLAANQLDRRLFDVTALISDGYDDQHSAAIPMILSYAGHTSVARSAQVNPEGVTRTRSLASINSTAVRAEKHNARKAWTSMTNAASLRSVSPIPELADGVTKIWLDGKVHTTLAQSTAQIGAPAAWAAGYDGTGVKVAVLDTGVDQKHPDLAGRISEAVSFVPGETADDGNGHGTHTTSTVGGDGAASGGLEKGVAPGSNLIMGKVLSDAGQGDDSWVIAGMQWAVAEGAKVISMSLGGTTPSDGTDPMSQALDQLSAQSGALFVVAAGNTGGEASMSAPGVANSALTVGAVDSNDQLASFSSTGPRFGDYALKPDISAPGVDILAAKAGGTADTGYYVSESGTSMATPHVAGAAAILAQEHPDWKGPQLKDALMSTSKALPDYTDYQVGNGRVDIANAITDPITATGSTYFGFDAWPHTDEPSVNRTVTYSNSSAAAVTLHLAESASIQGGAYDVDPTADAGTPAPGAMFALSTDTLVIPAKGTASVIATAQPSLGASGRRYLGQIVATNASDAVVARTAFGLYKEDARNTLHISMKDRQGSPAAGTIELQQFGNPDVSYAQVDASGELDLRLPQGTYSAVSYVDLPGATGPDSMGLALLGDPQIDLDQNRTLELDASKAVQVTAHVAKKTEDKFLSLDWYRTDGDQSIVDEQAILPSVYDSMWVLPTRKVTKGSFEFEARWRKTYPLLSITDKGSSIPSMEQSGSSLYDGAATLSAVYAGDGTDYTGLNAKGKVAIVTLSSTVSGTQRGVAAAAAGAKLVIEVNDNPGKYLDYVGNDDSTLSDIPVVGVTAIVGAPLIAKAKAGKLKLSFAGAPLSPYLYDLVAPYPGQIPAKVSYAPKASDLATVKMKFYGTKATPSSEFRWDYRPYRAYGSGFPMLTQMPGTRTDYVSAQGGTSWASGANTGPNFSLTSSSEVQTFKAGKSAASNWFSPVTRPRDGGGFISSTRYQGFAVFNVQPWADGSPEQAGYLTEGDDLLMKVWQGSTLVKTATGFAQAVLDGIPDGKTRYTVDLQASRDAKIWKLSPATHTVWQLNSPAVVDPNYGDIMPVMQLDYTVDTDLAGYAKGGWQTVGLTASQLTDAVGATTIAGGSMWVSYNSGTTFQQVNLTQSGAAGHWTARFQAPRTGFVTLKVQAFDKGGNSIVQTVTKAYGLK